MTRPVLWNERNASARSNNPEAYGEHSQPQRVTHDSASSMVSFGGRVVPVPMDGNCLFTAAYRELSRLNRCGKISSAATLRQSICDWIQRRGEETECAQLTLAQWILLETDECLDVYVARMRKNAEWGGIVELYAITEMFDVCTCVYEPIVNVGNQCRFARRHALEGRTASQRKTGSAVDHLHLHYNGRSHYSVFVPDPCPLDALPLHPSHRVALSGRATSGCSDKLTSLQMSSIQQPALHGAHGIRALSTPAHRSHPPHGESSRRGAAFSQRLPVKGRALRPGTARPTHQPAQSNTSTTAGRQQLSTRRRLVASQSSSRILRPAPSMRSLSQMGHAVKLSLRLERGGALPTRTNSLPREVRV